MILALHIIPKLWFRIVILQLYIFPKIVVTNNDFGALYFTKIILPNRDSFIMKSRFQFENPNISEITIK